MTFTDSKDKFLNSDDSIRISLIIYTVDTYAPQYSAEEQVHYEIYDYFQKVGNIDDIKTQNSTVVNVADTIIQSTMGFVMLVTTILMGVVFILTFRLNENN